LIDESKYNKHKDNASKLLSKSKKITFDIDSETFQEMWNNSHSDIPIGEKDEDGNERKEQMGYFVLDLKKAKITLEVTNGENNTHEKAPVSMYGNNNNSSRETKLFYIDGTRNYLVIGTIHTHPNTEAENYERTPAKNTSDVRLSNIYDMPLYYFDDSNVDKITPSSLNDNYKSKSELMNGTFDIAKDTFKSFIDIHN